MSHQDIDTRVTAYVFGELSPEAATAFERELESSNALQEEVAAIREAVAALQTEFHSQSGTLQESHRSVVEQTIEQASVQRSSAPSNNAVLRSLTTTNEPISAIQRAEQGSTRRFVQMAALAASVLIVAGLAYPYLRRGDLQSVSMSQPEKPAEKPAETSMETAQTSTLASSLPALDETASVDESLFSGFETYDDPSQTASRGTVQEQMQNQAANVLDRQTNATESTPALQQSGASRHQPLSVSVTGQGVSDARTDGETVDHFQLGPSSAGKAIIVSGGMLGGGGAESGGKAAGSPKKQPARRSRRRSEPFMEMEMGDTDTDMMDMMMDMGGMEMGMEMEPEMLRESETMGMGGAAMNGSMMEMYGLQGEAVLNFSIDVEADEMSVGMDLHDEDLSGVNLRRKLSAAGDRYASIRDNPFVNVSDAALSTFSIDVDTASYAKVRMLLNQNSLPRPDAVRIEEMLNYFDYDYPAPQDERPFAASMDIAQCPWRPEHRLARIGIKGKVIQENRPSSNLVFLLDVSGSMDEPSKLPLVIAGMKMLTDQLTENDKVAIVVYAGAAGLVLDATHGDKKQLIEGALDRLHAGGSTNGGHGILLAYEVARDNFIVGGTNRVILCSDGDFNVGVTGTDQLVRIAEQNAKSNIFLTVLGFGIGNHNDAMMEQISNKANGNYAFIDSRSEAEKVLVREIGGTLVTIAKDVKIQIEFNPQEVASYRLIGYENRVLAAQDFNDDTKDAGEIGAGHTVTALYEIVPSQSNKGSAKSVDDLRYQRGSRLSEQASSGEMLVLKLRYKQPTGDTSELIEIPVTDSGKRFSRTDRDFQFAASVAAFGMLLRDSPYKGSSTLASVARLAQKGARGDDFGYRQEFVELVKKAIRLRNE